MKPNRFKEFICVIFGHDWSESGGRKDIETGIYIDRYKKCSNCELEIHDHSGALELYKMRFGTHNLSVQPTEKSDGG